MKIIVDLINKSLKVLENEKNIYVGNNNADVLKLYCYNNDYPFVNEFVSITGLLSNGRKIGPFTTDSAYEYEVIDGNQYIVANFTLTKQNGFTLSEGQLNITVWHNKTNDSGAIVSKQAIGNLLFNVVRTANVDENIIITDANGDVIYNFQLEIENIQSAVADINNKLNTTNQILNTKANTAYVDNNFVKNTKFNEELNKKANIAYVDNNIIDLRDNLENKINEVKYDLEKLDEKYLKVDEEDIGIYADGIVDIEAYSDINLMSTEGEIVLNGNYQVSLKSGSNELTLDGDGLKLNAKEIATKQDIANLVNSAPATLDTLGELAKALEDNKEVVEALDEAIGKKADITYVDEKVANAGVPSDLLDRVETLETLSEEAVYMEDTEFDVEEETGGSVCGYVLRKTIITQGEVAQTLYGDINWDSDTNPRFNFNDLDLDNKYLKIDLGLLDQEFEELKSINQNFFRNEGADFSRLDIDFSEKTPKNSIIEIFIPDKCWSFEKPIMYDLTLKCKADFIKTLYGRFEIDIDIYGFSHHEDFSDVWLLNDDGLDKCLKIEFNELGLCKVYFYSLGVEY